MQTFTKTYLIGGIIVLFHFATSQAQNASLILSSGSYYVGGNASYSVLAGNIETGGNIISTATNTFSFKGNLQQKITCISPATCGTIFNNNMYNTVLGNVFQDNVAGIRIESNTKVLGTHIFNNGGTEIAEGNYWLANTTNPYSNNNSTDKFFVTTGHGLLKQSNIGSLTFFPMGSHNNANDYAPVYLLYGGTADNFGARVLDDVYSSYNITNGDPIGAPVNNAGISYVRKTWIVNKEIPVTDYTDGFLASMQWNAANEDAGFNHNAVDVSRNHDATWFSSNVLSAAGGASPGPYTYNATKIITYDNMFYPYYPITINSVIKPLPVTGLKLVATASNNNIATLNWQTLTEANSNYFLVEKSFDGINYTSFGTVVAAGNSTTGKYYGTIDRSINAPGNVVYYRIREVDKDGVFSFSNVIMLKLNVDAGSSISIYPNPVVNDVLIYFKKATGNYAIHLMDNSGRIVATQVVNVVGQWQQVSISRQNLSAGTYFVTVINKTNGAAQTFLVNFL